MYFVMLVLAAVISFLASGLAFYRRRFWGRCVACYLLAAGLILLGTRQLFQLYRVTKDGEVALNLINSGGELLISLVIFSVIVLDYLYAGLFDSDNVIEVESVGGEDDLFPGLESEQEFRTFFEAAPDIIGWVDRDGYVRNINRAFEEKFGYDREEIVGSHITEVSFIADESLEKIKRKHRRRQSGEEVKPYTVKAWDSEANARYLELNVYQVQDEGKVRGNIVTSRDITERRRAEKRTRNYRRAIECSEDPIFAIDRDYCFLFANQAYRETLNVDQNNLRGKQVSEVLAPDIVEQIKPRLDRCLNGGKVRYNVIREGSGEERRHFDISYHPLKNQSGEVVGLSGVLKDVTECRRSQEKLEATLEEKEMLLQEVHHRVKNNMQLITSLLDMQTLHVDDPRAREQLNDSRQRVHTLAQVHENIYRSGDLAGLNFEDYISDLVDEIRAQYEKRVDNLSLQVEAVDFGLSRAIYLGLIINELVTNAYKYGVDKGAEEAQITVEFSAVKNGYRLLVEDNGPGLPEDFELGANGCVGLQLVQSLSRKQLKGELKIDGEAPGACFKIEIPEAADQ